MNVIFNQNGWSKSVLREGTWEVEALFDINVNTRGTIHTIVKRVWVHEIIGKTKISTYILDPGEQAASIDGKPLPVEVEGFVDQLLRQGPRNNDNGTAE